MEHQKAANRDSAGGPPAFSIRHTFDDVDELAEVAKAWDIDFRQLNRGGFCGGLVQAGADRLQLARTQLRGILHQRGTAPARLLNFVVPSARQIELRWRGDTIGRDEILVYQPLDEIECTSHPDFDMLIVSVSIEGLENACRRADLSVNVRSINEPEHPSCERTAIGALRRWVKDNLLSVSQNPSVLREPEIAGALEDEACGLLIRCLIPNLGEPRRRHSSHSRRLVDDAVSIARHRAYGIHTVGALSRASGASERTLRRGFRERFGVSPKEYLQAQRLIGVRVNSVSRTNTCRSATSPASGVSGTWDNSQRTTESSLESYRRKR